MKYQVNWEKAPTTKQAFKKWHKLACANDPLTADERFKQHPKAKKESTND